MKTNDDDFSLFSSKLVLLTACSLTFDTLIYYPLIKLNNIQIFAKSLFSRTIYVFTVFTNRECK